MTYKNVVPDHAPVSDEVRNHPMIKLCGGTCGRHTRTTRMLLTEFPNTVTRADGTHCTRCLQAETGVPQRNKTTPEQTARTTVGLDRFMAGRIARAAKARSAAGAWASR